MSGSNGDIVRGLLHASFGWLLDDFVETTPTDLMGFAVTVPTPRCPNGVGRRIGHPGHHVLDPVHVAVAHASIGGAVVPCERCFGGIYVPPVVTRAPKEHTLAGDGAGNAEGDGRSACLGSNSPPRQALCPGAASSPCAVSGESGAGTEAAVPRAAGESPVPGAASPDHGSRADVGNPEGKADTDEQLVRALDRPLHSGGAGSSTDVGPGAATGRSAGGDL